MTNFLPLNVRKYQKTGKVETPDTKYWQRLSVPTLVKEFGAIDYVDFNPVEPYCFAVTCSVRVQIYNPITKLVVKNLSRFQETAYGGSFRKDGRLLVAGDEQGLVKLFDTSSRNVLRLFKGHTAPVHRTFFSADLLNIASFSDDCTVRQWDVANERSIHTYAGVHTDYIRAGAMNPISSNIFISGGYDGQIKMYDTRTHEVTNTVSHGCPVESLIFLPSGGIFLSAGGTEVRVWDAFAGCRLLTKLSQHHKTVTCLRLGSNGRRIFSSGLDQHVKIYDVATYQTVHTLKFPNAVLSLGVAPKDQAVVAGMVDGLVSIQTMTSPKSSDASGGDRGGGKQKESRIHGVPIEKSKPIIQVDQVIKNRRNAPKLAAYDQHLKKYDYKKALDCVLSKRTMKYKPEILITVFHELIHRKGLQRALVGRTSKSLATITNFICRYIGENRFMRVLTDVTSILLDLYADRFSEFNGQLGRDFTHLANVLQQEVRLTHELLELQGAIELLLAAASAENRQDEMIHFVQDNTAKLKQSSLAKDLVVVTV